MRSAQVTRFKPAGVTGKREGAFLPEPDPLAMSLDRQDEEVCVFWQESLSSDLSDRAVVGADERQTFMARAG